MRDRPAADGVEREVDDLEREEQVAAVEVEGPHDLVGRLVVDRRWRRRSDWMRSPGRGAADGHPVLHRGPTDHLAVRAVVERRAACSPSSGSPPQTSIGASVGRYAPSGRTPRRRRCGVRGSARPESSRRVEGRAPGSAGRGRGDRSAGRPRSGISIVSPMAAAGRATIAAAVVGARPRRWTKLAASVVGVDVAQLVVEPTERSAPPSTPLRTSSAAPRSCSWR